MTYDQIDNIFVNLNGRLNNSHTKDISSGFWGTAHSESFLFEQFVARLTAAYDASNSDLEFKFAYFGKQHTISESVASKVAHKMPSGYYSRFGNGAYYLLTLSVHWQIIFSDNDGWQESESPFEPIIRLLERGGTITREGKLYYVGNRAFREVRIETNIVKSLNDEFLDSLDRKE